MRKAARKASAISSMSSLSDASPNDLSDDHGSDQVHDCCRPKQLHTDRPAPQNSHAGRIHQVQQETQYDRHQRENPTGETALCSVNANLPLQPETVSNHMSGLFEYLGQVAATLLLNQDRGYQQPDVGNRHPVREVVHGDSQVKSEVLLVETLPKLARNRFRVLPGGEVDGGGESVTGADGAHHQVESLGKLFLKVRKALSPLVQNQQPRAAGGKSAEGQRNEQSLRS